MVSVAAEINSPGGRRRTVQVYAPGRQVFPGRAAVAPTRRTNAPQRGGVVDWSKVESAFANTDAAKKHIEQTAQKAAEGEAWDQTPWYKKGLGMVLGNPVTKNLLVPLGAFSTLGRGMTLGVEEAGEAVAGAPDLVQNLISNSALRGLLSVDTKRTEADKRSNWSKLRPTSDYGFGQIAPSTEGGEITIPGLGRREIGGPNMDRVIGFGGDILLDPLTYATAGATRLANSIPRAAKIAELTASTNRVNDVITKLDDAARLKNTGDFNRLSTQAQHLADEHEALARRLIPEIESGAVFEVPVRQGRKGRASFIGELAEENPALLEKYGSELARAGERGVNTIRDPALREALGLVDPSFRLMGTNIPGSRRLIEEGVRPLGALRAKTHQLPLLGKAGSLFDPKGLEGALGTLTRGKGGDVPRAAALVRTQNLMKRGAGSFELRANRELTRLVRSWKDKSTDEIRTLMRQAELDAAPNDINKFFKGLTDIFESVAGRPMKVTRDEGTYVPHMMTPQFKRYLQTKLEDGTLDPKALERELGFTKVDLLEGSKYLEKSRKLTPDTPGTPKDFDIRGETITLSDGTVDELNSELARVFGDFKGKAYMDDPVMIAESYISSVARQAGRDFAIDRMAASPNKMFREITGELADAIEARNNWARSNPVVEMVKKGYIKGQRAIPAKPRGDMPTSPFDDMFSTTKHVAETQAQRNLLMKEGKQYVSDVAADVAATRKSLGETLKGLRSTLMDGLQKKGRQAVSDIRAIDATLGKLGDDIKALGPLTTENMDEMVGVHHAVENLRVTTKAEIKKIRDRYGKKIPRDVKAIDKELGKTLDILDQRLDEVRQQYARSSDALRREAADRKRILEEPLVEAQKQIDAAEAALGPRPVAKERVQEAHAFRRSDFETEDAYEAERQLWRDELAKMRAEGVPILRKVDGRLTPETKEVIRGRVAQAAEVEPPPPVRPEVKPAIEPPAAAVPEAPPAAVVPEPEPVVPPAPAPAPKKSAADYPVKRRLDGNYFTDDGFEIVPEGREWRIILDGEEDFGVFPKIKEAKAYIRQEQEGWYGTADEVVTPPVVPEVAEEVTAPAVPTEVTPEPAAAPIRSAEPPKPTTNRITRGREWKKKVDDTGREITVGPDGWQIEEFEASTRMGLVDEAVSAEAGRVAPIRPSRGKRYVAIHPDPDKDVLRARSWGSERDAKIAVEDLLRKQKHRVTSAEYLARGAGRPEPPVVATYENLGSQIPPTPSTLTPEEAAANLGAVAPTKPRPPHPDTPAPGPVYEPTEEGARLAAMQPPPAAPPTDPYWAAHREWQEQELLTMSAPTARERAAAKRRAKQLAGEFNQPTGKYHQRWSAENVIMEDDAWELKKIDTKTQQGQNYIKAKANYEKVKNDIDRQVEAMVYVKGHDPILGEDTYTRAYDTTVGFGPGEERKAVLPQPPTEGHAPTGTRDYGYEEPPTSNYDPATRARDRAILDDPSVMAWAMPDNKRRYSELVERDEEINFRIHVADTNRARLDDLDRAAKAAYTDEVKAADQAVLDAKRARVSAEMTAASEEAGPGAASLVAEAKRAEQAAIANQTTVREAWSAADQAHRDALALREEYLKVANEATMAEQALYTVGGDGKKIVEAIKETDRAGVDHLRREISLPPKMSHQQSTMAQRLIRSLTELNAARDMGMEFMTDAERRNLTGIRVGIDAEKRELRHALNQDVQRIKDVLPERSPAEELAQLHRPEGFETARFGAEAPPPLRIPPVEGHEGLAGRAYAESFEPTVPGKRSVWQLTEEGVPVEVVKPHGRVPYTPRTEREAIGELGKEATAIERAEAGTPQAQALAQEEKNIGREVTGAFEKADKDKMIATMESTVARDEALSPLGDRIETLKLVDDSLNEKAKLIPIRDQAEAQRKQIVATKPTGKKADLVRVIDELAAVARQNPDLLDDDLAVVEALLQASRGEASTLAEKDLSQEQVQRLINKIGNKDDKSLDVMLTTVGRDWKMLYDTYGKKKPVLKKGDIVVDAQLADMFQNLHQIRNDKVLFGRTLNAFTNLFKTYATLTPGFHVRNALSAIFMNSADGVALRTQFNAAKLWKDYMDGGEEWLKALPGKKIYGIDGQQIADAFSVAGGSGAGGRFTEAGFAEAVEGGGWIDYLEKLQRNRFTRWSQRAGTRVEGSVRLAMALDSMMIGESVEAAIQRVNRIHFDYSEISRFDENAKRLIPFWTFMSRNMPMQVSQMWTKPRVYMQYEHFTQNMAAVNEEYTPEYWTKAGAFNTGATVPNIPGLGGAQGLPVYLSPDLGFTRLEADLKDYEDFLSGKRPGGVLGQVNPLVSAPVEFMTRQDIFTGQRFEEGETVPAGGPLGWPIKALAMLTGQYEDGEVDAAFANTVRALNPLQDRSSRLFPQLSGGDPEGKKRQLESWARTMLGAPVRTLTPKQQENEYYRQYYDQLDAMERMLERQQRQMAG